ncbi:MAG: PAS domain S-box protein, partial [Pseudomonadota bacterium]|nr:PAS domain S-box protein [Pseudomonadota bacterium]
MSNGQVNTPSPDSHLLRAIFDSAADAIITLDLEGVMTSWNPAAEGLFGYTAKEAVGQNVKLLIPPDRIKEAQTIFEHLVGGEKSHYLETVRQRKDGRLIEVLTAASQLYDPDRGIIGISKVVRDISAIKRSWGSAEEMIRQKMKFEGRLEEQAAFLKNILDNLPVSIFAKDVKQGYRWILWNKMAVAQFKMTEEDVIGRVDYDLFPKAEADFFRKTDELVMAGRDVVDIPVEPITTIDRTWLSHTKK